MLTTETVFNEMFAALHGLKDHHNRDSKVYAFLEAINAKCIKDLFSPSSQQQMSLEPFGLVQLPFYTMGAINSTHLFGLDEIIIFSFYAANAKRYINTADIGANIGLHSIMMAKLGFQVQSYEPDPITFAHLNENIKRNGLVGKIRANSKAVSTEKGTLEFTRVLGNTTGSHLSGSKENPYGELELFEVEVESFIEIMRSVDLMKIDVEGHEAKILCGTSRDDWANVDAMVEIGTVANAQRVHAHMSAIGVNMFSQKNAWKRVNVLAHMPTTYKEGSLFVSTKDEMPWGGGR
jgi:FkbM family methyltransferase